MEAAADWGLNHSDAQLMFLRFRNGIGNIQPPPTPPHPLLVPLFTKREKKLLKGSLCFSVAYWQRARVSEADGIQRTSFWLALQRPAEAVEGVAFLADRCLVLRAHFAVFKIRTSEGRGQRSLRVITLMLDLIRQSLVSKQSENA